VRIRNQVLLVIIGFLTLAMVVFAVVLYWVQYNALQSGMDEGLKTAATMTADIFPPDFIEKVKQGTVTDADKTLFSKRFNKIYSGANIDYLWAEMLVGGKLVYFADLSREKNIGEGSFTPYPKSSSEQAFYNRLTESKQPFYWDAEIRSGKLRVIMMPFTDFSGNVFVVGAGRYEQKLEAQMQSTLYSSLAGMAVLLLIAVLAGWLLARSLARPIEMVTETAARIARGEKPARIKVQGSDELAQLAESINRMNLAIQDREERIKEVVDHTTTALYKRNFRLDINEYISPAVATISGFSVEEFLAKTKKEYLELIHPEDRERVRAKLEAVIASGGKSFQDEYRFIRKDGTIRWMLDNLQIFMDETGRPEFGIGNVQDITERKEAQIALQKSEELYRLLSENMKDVIWTLDTETLMFRYISPSIKDLRGYTPEEAIAMPLYDTLAERNRDEFVELIRRETGNFMPEKGAAGRFFTNEIEQTCKDGSTIWTEVVSRFYINPENGRVELCGVTRDIGERKRAEQALRASEQQFRLLADTLPVGIVLTRMTGENIYFNQTFIDLFGYSFEETPTTNEWWALAYPDENYRAEIQKEWYGRVDRCFKTHTPFETMDALVTCKDGSTRFVEFRVSVMDDRLLIVFGDLTERKRAEEALRASEFRFRSLYDNMAEGVALHRMIYDDYHRAIDYEIIDINPQYEKALNLERKFVINRRATGIYGTPEPPYLEQFAMVLATGIPYHFETYFEPMDKYFYISVARMGEDQFASIFFDISEAKCKEAEIEHLSSFPRLNPNPVLEINQSGEVIYANPAAYELLKQVGLLDDLHAFLPSNFNDFFIALVNNQGNNLYHEIEMGGRFFGETFSYINETGTVRLYSIDITERRQAEEAMRSSRDRMLRAEEVALSGNWEIDLNQSLMRVSEGGARIYGMDRLEWTVAEGRGVPLPEYRPWLEQAIRDLILKGIHYDAEYKIVRQNDGELRDIHAMAEYDSQRRVVFGIIQDITERKQMENALRESEERFKRITNEMVDLVAQFDARINYVYVSPSYERILGYRPDELIGFPAVNYLHPDEVKKAVQEISLVLNSGEGLVQFRYRHKDGTYRWFESTGKSMCNENGEIIGAIMASRDITDRKQVEEEVQRLNADLERRVEERTAQLEASNKELEAFAYSVSHDLRAPLRSIDGFSLALLEDVGPQLDKTSLGHLERVRAAAQRMGLLIDNLLKLSRVTRSEMAFNNKVDLSAIAQRVADELQATQPERNIDWVIARNVVVRGDEKLLEVALTNLLSNAHKFTAQHPNARIEFGTEIQDGTLVYFVRDDGAGFDMTYADKLFGVFQRLHNASIFEGTGIGLATVQRIIFRHGGKIWAVSEEEKGAAFYFTLATPLFFHPAT
jgi:PAS domain S-box-containing protein